MIQGLSGTSTAVFTVQIFGVSHIAASVVWATLDGTATAFDDYLPTNGTMIIPAGAPPTSFNVTVTILGESLNEAPQDFFLELGGPQHALLDNSTGDCTVINTAPEPTLYINNVHVTTNSGGTLSAVFTVALDRPSGQVVTVAYNTADGTALAGVNYLAQADVLTFLPGSTSQLISITVIGDTTYTPDETFSVDLTHPAHALLNVPTGVGTIIYGNPPPSQYIIDDGDPGYTQTSSGWTSHTNTLSYQLDYESHTAGSGADTAAWTFSNIPTGSYQVFADWVPFMNWASNAPFTIYDGSTSKGTVLVNQQIVPTGDQSNGFTWQSLGTFDNTTGTLAVRLADNANGYVVADAIRIVANGIGASAANGRLGVQCLDRQCRNRADPVRRHRFRHHRRDH